MRARLVLAVALSLLLPGSALAHGTHIVSNTNDSGDGSLRAALLVADAGSEVVFEIEGGGVHTITPLTPLPPIGTGVSIDGTTQPNASCASWPPTLTIEIDGHSLPAGSDALSVVGNAASIRGLVINRAPRHGVAVTSVSGLSFTCNLVGTDPSGTIARGNGGSGLSLQAVVLAEVGGAFATSRNLFSGNGGAGVEISALSSDETILGNYVGTTISGLAPLGNAIGIHVLGSSSDIGGPGLGGNLISAHVVGGIVLDANSALDNQIAGNQIGVDATGGILETVGVGVVISQGASGNTVGLPSSPNVIHGNANGGVAVANASIENQIRGNSLSLNGGNGIDLIGDLLGDENDAGDVDEGANRIQNWPELTAASYTSATDTVAVTFSVDSPATSSLYPLTIDLYVADAEDQEGEVYLGATSYTLTDFGTGVVQRSFVTDAPVSVGDRLVATATDAAGNTSEFSPPIVTPEPGTIAAALAGALALAALRGRGRR